MVKKSEAETPEIETPDPALVAAFGEEGAVLVDVYIPSKDRDTKHENVNGETVKYVYGSINGEKFQVQCDKAVKVPKAIADVVQPQPKVHGSEAAEFSY